MKRLPRDADLTNLSRVEHGILKMCMSKYCLNDMEACPCNGRIDSSKYCEFYNQMVKVYAKICRDEPTMSVKKTA